MVEDWTYWLLFCVVLVQSGTIMLMRRHMDRGGALLEEMIASLNQNSKLMADAANDIDRLETENAAMRAALEDTGYEVTTVSTAGGLESLPPAVAAGMRETLTRLLDDLKRRDN